MQVKIWKISWIHYQTLLQRCFCWSGKIIPVCRTLFCRPL